MTYNVSSGTLSLYTAAATAAAGVGKWLGRQRQVWLIPLADERGVCR